LVAAARELLSRGITPSVKQAAAAAAVSRPTAYRYFQNQRELLSAAHPELSMRTLLPDSPPRDPLQRLDLASQALVRLLLQHEVALRAMLRISLEAERDEHAPLALRTGRRIEWMRDALAPLKTVLTPKRFRALVLAIAATLGIEQLVWLVDVAGVKREDAVHLMRSSARDLLRAAI
jgi:AcrR family transcriptional regulator